MSILAVRPPFRTLHDSRDVAVIAFPLSTDPESFNAQIAVLWDEDRDERILQVLIALRFRDTRALGRIIAVAEHRGVIDAWCLTQVPEVTRALTNAANAALRPLENWKVNPAHLVTTPDLITPVRYAPDHAALSPDSALKIIPERFVLGLVRA